MKRQFKSSSDIPPVETGFYFARNKNGQDVVRVLHEDIDTIWEDNEDVDEDSACYGEYPITSRDAFVANYPHFVFVELQKRTVGDVDVYLNPAAIEWVSVYSEDSLSMSLSFQHEDIGQYWDLRSVPKLDADRFLDLYMNSEHDDDYIGRVLMNRDFFRAELEAGNIRDDYVITEWKNVFSPQRMLDRLTQESRKPGAAPKRKK